MKTEDNLVDRHRKNAVHFLDQRTKPAQILCLTPVSHTRNRTNYTGDAKLVTCRACHDLLRPKQSGMF